MPLSCTLQPATGDAPLDVLLRSFPVPGVAPNIAWPVSRIAANGERYGVDRGASNDAYMADIVFEGDVAAMNDIAEWLEQYGRVPFRITAISGLIFPPSVAQGGTISVAPVARDREQRVFFAPAEDGVDNLSMRLRVVSPDVSGTASLAGLVLQETFEADKSTTIAIPFSLAGVPHPVDMDGDAGRFVARFRQDSVATAQALRYLLASQRATAFALPEFPSVEYPFGRVTGTYPLAAKCVRIGIRRVDLSMWELTLEFAQSFEEPI